MQATPENLQVMQQVLEQTLNPEPTARKQAEDFLTSSSGAAGYGLVLLQVLTMDSVPPHIRQAGAVTFKNYVKRGWRSAQSEERWRY